MYVREFADVNTTGTFKKKKARDKPLPSQERRNHATDKDESLS